MHNKIKRSALALTLSLSLTMTVAGYCDSTSKNTLASATNTDSNTGSADADNSIKNKRDRRDDTLTPADQGASKQDLEITSRIRRAVVSETNSFSMTAKNIKIITVNGKVTLRGPVQNNSEKTRIDGFAKDVAGEGNVKDLLEVKNNP